jgi:hypothetical protein
MSSVRFTATPAPPTMPPSRSDTLSLTTYGVEASARVQPTTTPR